jgi:hypothetical protein
LERIGYRIDDLVDVFVKLLVAESQDSVAARGQPFVAIFVAFGGGWFKVLRAI